jgi:hypothetical protein
MEGKKKKKQLFRQYDEFNGDTFLEFLKKFMLNFKNVICLWIKQRLIMHARK